MLTPLGGAGSANGLNSLDPTRSQILSCHLHRPQTRESANWRCLCRWRGSARLAFWRQFEPDELVAALPCRIDRRHESFRMPFEHANVVRAEHDKSQFAAFQILLIFETLIRRDQDSKPGVFRCAQKIASTSRAFPIQRLMQQHFHEGVVGEPLPRRHILTTLICL